MISMSPDCLHWKKNKSFYKINSNPLYVCVIGYSLFLLRGVGTWGQSANLFLHFLHIRSPSSSYKILIEAGQATKNYIFPLQAIC